MSTLERAIAIAAEAHAGQVDKAGFPYILHPSRVMHAMRSYDGQIVGVLHDVVEDSQAWSLAMLRAEGFGAAITEALGFLTRAEEKPYAAYIDDLVRFGSPIAQAVKLADIRDNLRAERISHLPSGEQLRLEAKYRPAFKRLATLPDIWRF